MALEHKHMFSYQLHHIDEYRTQGVKSGIVVLKAVDRGNMALNDRCSLLSFP